MVTVTEPADDSGAEELIPPTTTTLQAIAPNPFNPVTIIRFSLARAEHVRLAAFDLRGRLVRALVDGRIPAGHHATTWDGTNGAGHPVGSGVYLCRMEAGAHSEARRLTLIK